LNLSLCSRASPVVRATSPSYGNAMLRTALWMAAQTAARMRENSFRRRLNNYVRGERYTCQGARLTSDDLPKKVKLFGRIGYIRPSRERSALYSPPETKTNDERRAHDRRADDWDLARRTEKVRRRQTAQTLLSNEKRTIGDPLVPESRSAEATKREEMSGTRAICGGSHVA
jgi:hypothetical protein